MALGSHLITVRRLQKYIDDVIGKKANLPDTSKTIIGNISQINSDLSDMHLWYPTNFVKNGSQSTLTGNIAHNNVISMTKIDVTWKNPTTLTSNDLLILTFTDNFPSYPTHLLATVGSTVTYAYYNSYDHGLYIRVPNGQYLANNDVIIAGFLGLQS